MKKKRIMSTALALMLIFALLPTIARAQNEPIPFTSASGAKGNVTFDIAWEAPNPYVYIQFKVTEVIKYFILSEFVESPYGYSADSPERTHPPQRDTVYIFVKDGAAIELTEWENTGQFYHLFNYKSLSFGQSFFSGNCKDISIDSQTDAEGFANGSEEMMDIDLAITLRQKQYMRYKLDYAVGYIDQVIVNFITIDEATEALLVAGGIPNKPSTSTFIAKPTVSTVYVNGVSKAFEAYNIGGSNYFKLRDLAYVLNGTTKQFAVGYDNSNKAITLTSSQPYTTADGEMAKGDGKEKTASPTASTIYFNGNELSLTVYNIGGNNFFKLRNLMQVIDVFVGYDNNTKAITLDTSKGYIPE